jgi:hypothetical protein
MTTCNRVKAALYSLLKDSKFIRTTKEAEQKRPLILLKTTTKVAYITVKFFYKLIYKY